MIFIDPMELMELSAEERELYFAWMRLQRLLAVSRQKLACRAERYHSAKFTPEEKRHVSTDARS